MALYFQPTKIRSNDNSLPTAPDEGVDISALIDELTSRINQATRKIEYKVDSKALAKVILTDRDIVLMGDRVNVVGQLNIVDWIRDLSGNPTGGIDETSITRIVGGKIQTGIIQSVNWSVSAGSQFNLDAGTIVTGGSNAPKFSVNTSGVLTCIDAIVKGTLQAGSVIAGSVTINNALGPTLDEIAAGADVQGALNAGVSNILAGIGSDFRLDVDTTNGFVALRHKDAVFLGTATAGSVKPGLGISATGIGIGYNRASDGAWVTTITMDASGNAAFLGTVSAGSIISGSATVSGTTMTDIRQMATDGFDINQALTVSGTTVLKGVLQPNNTGAVAVGSITWNSTTGALVNGTGIAITEWGIIGASAGVATFTLQASNGAATFKGDITGGSNINITGQGRFDGSTTEGGATYAVVANSSGAASHGVLGLTDSGIGVWGASVAGSGSGVFGSASSSTAVGVKAQHNGTGTALQVLGKMTINNTTVVSNLNADMVDGKQVSALCQIVVTDSGTCTVSGNGFNLNCTVSGVRTRGTSNIVVIENFSDRRLKNDIKKEVLGLDFINKLKPVTYRIKASPQIKYHGFIGQFMERVLGGTSDDALCRLLDDGMIGTDYVSMIAPIVKAIQELNLEVEKLKTTEL